MKNNQTSDEILESIIKLRIQKRKQFYIHLVLFFIVLLVFAAKQYLGIRINFFPFKYINFQFIIVWSIIFIAYVVSFILTEKSLGKKWEEGKIGKIIDSQKVETKTWE